MTALLTRFWHRYSGTFVGNVAVVAGGIAVAQIIGIVFLPLITRLYGPEAFGMLNVFMSIVAVLASIATLSYASSIVLPKRDVVAYQLLKISLLLACFVSITTGFLFMILKEPIVALFDLEAIASFLWLIPLAVFLSAISQSFDQWNIRNKRYKSVSIAVVAQAGFMGVSRTGAGMLMPTTIILIVLALVAQAIQICVLYLTARRDIAGVRKYRGSTNHRQLAVLHTAARKYQDFPRYRAPQIFLNTISRAAPLLLLASVFSPAVAGFYAIAQSVLYLPVSLVSQSVGKVFLQRIATQAHDNKPIRPLILRATYALILLGIVPFGVIMLAGPWLFGFVFGAEWSEAGNYARWLAIWVFFNFINVPAVQSLALTNSQGILLIWEIVTTAIKIALILAVGIMTKNAELTVAVYAVLGAVAYLVLIFIGIVQAGKYDRNSQE